MPDDFAGKTLGAGVEHFTQWQAQHPKLRLSINLAVKTLQQDDALQTLKRSLSAHGLLPQNIEIEIAEKQLSLLGAELNTVVSAWRQAGFTLAIDDFDASHTSIGELHAFNFDVLKLDPGLLDGLTEGEATGVVSSILTLANNLGVVCCAEGVETSEQARLLTQMGCPLLQGYHLGEPLSADDIAVYLALKHT